jgi:hypothetical protein
MRQPGGPMRWSMAQSDMLHNSPYYLQSNLFVAPDFSSVCALRPLRHCLKMPSPAAADWRVDDPCRED